MRIDEVVKPFTGKQVRAKDDLTGDWIDAPGLEYVVVADGKAIATYDNVKDAELRSKKERLKGRHDAKVVEL